MEKVRRTIPAISISEVRSLLKRGYTRLADDDEGFGSIQEHYNISAAGVRNLFKNEYLKGLKTIFPEFELVVDVDDIPVAEDEEIEEIPDEVLETEVLERGSFAGGVVEYPATVHTDDALSRGDVAKFFGSLADEAREIKEELKTLAASNEEEVPNADHLFD